MSLTSKYQRALFELLDLKKQDVDRKMAIQQTVLVRRQFLGSNLNNAYITQLVYDEKLTVDEAEKLNPSDRKLLESVRHCIDNDEATPQQVLRLNDLQRQNLYKLFDINVYKNMSYKQILLAVDQANFDLLSKPDYINLVKDNIVSVDEVIAKISVFSIDWVKAVLLQGQATAADVIRKADLLLDIHNTRRVTYTGHEYDCGSGRDIHRFKIAGYDDMTPVDIIQSDPMRYVFYCWTALTGLQVRCSIGVLTLPTS